LYNGESNYDTHNEWIDILEAYFREQNRAFLIFDRDNILRYVSDFAHDILEITDNQIGMLSVYDVFPRSRNNSNFILDKNNKYIKVNDFTYTTPSGKPVEVRFNLDRKPGSSGYIVWIEPRMSDSTGTFRKITTYDIHKKLKPIFDSNELGFMIIDKRGLIIDHNEQIKYVLRLPGEWEGRNIFSFPPLHEIKFEEFIHNCLNSRSGKDSKIFKIKYSSKAVPLKIRMSVIQIQDPAGAAIGALISSRIES
jgi:hypothetical protein